VALSLQERERIRYHLGYLNTAPGQSIFLGLPAASQPLFILESAMNSILPEAEDTARRAVRELDCIEDQLSQQRGRLGIVTAETGIRFDIAGALHELEDQYQLWARTLADVFGVPINPFSLRHQRMTRSVFVSEPL